MYLSRCRIRASNYKKNRRSVHKRFNLFQFERRSSVMPCPSKSLPRVVVLTGAGISAESGIQTFRDAGGLWEDHRIEDVATPAGFSVNPQRVQQFYNSRRRQLLQPALAPNAAHYALAELEQLLQERFLLVTQNIDNLHERAGNRRVIHMHGELLKVRCVVSGQPTAWQGDLSVEDRCRCCEQPAPLRPHIVWFGEMPLEMETISQAIAEANLFIAIGTSGQVYPAAGFVSQAKQHRAQALELNLAPSQVSDQFNEHGYGLASEVVPRFVRDFIAQFNPPVAELNNSK